ncbi:hypothetical protein VKT23_010305 [Stygiomarasmius scandens]|uniref:Uncharacterized protein n=1 Tax=Marasmiellus scandens TaxID=2682957 RepID=A0ABR1JBX3_9AGAR
MNAILASGLIFSLTGHAQDFRDRSGDALLGRRTIPLILPQTIARWSLILAMSGLTLGLIKLWEPPVLVAALFGLLGVITSAKFAIDYSEEQDRKTFRWYELWLIMAHFLPLFERFSNEDVAVSRPIRVMLMGNYRFFESIF